MLTHNEFLAKAWLNHSKSWFKFGLNHMNADEFDRAVDEFDRSLDRHRGRRSSMSPCSASRSNSRRSPNNSASRRPKPLSYIVLLIKQLTIYILSSICLHYCHTTFFLCDAALHLSQHTKIGLLPNVHINEKMELSGFQFDGAGCDMANVLPISSNLFDCIVAYEVKHDTYKSFNDKV